MLTGALMPEIGIAQSVGHDLETAGKDMLHIWSAPSRFKASALPEIGFVFGGTGALLLIDEWFYKWLSTHRRSLPGAALGVFTEDKPLNLLGRSFVLVPTSLLLYGVGWAADRPDLRHAGLGCISSNLATTLSRSLLNRVIDRFRPRYQKGAFEIAVRPIIGSTWETRSFPGGHAANIMACVSFWNNRFDLGVAEPALYAVALGVGWARVLDGAHWPSDTFFAEAYGWTVGRAVAHRYRERLPDRATVPGGGGFEVGLRFSF